MLRIMKTVTNPFYYLENTNLNTLTFEGNAAHASYSRIKRIQNLAVWLFSKVIPWITFGKVSFKYEDPRVAMLSQHLTHLQDNLPEELTLFLGSLKDLQKKEFVTESIQTQIATLKAKIIPLHLNQLEQSNFFYDTKLSALTECISTFEMDSSFFELLVKTTCEIYIHTLNDNGNRMWIGISNQFRKFVQDTLHPSIQKLNLSSDNLSTTFSSYLEEAISGIDSKKEDRIREHATKKSNFIFTPSSLPN